MKIAVIGGGASLLERELGETIDTDFTIITRTNCAPTIGYEKYVGTRTDYVLLRGGGAQEFEPEFGHTKIITLSHAVNRVLREKGIKNIVETWGTGRRKITRAYKLKGNLSSGIIAICYWLLKDVKPVYVAGIDAFKYPNHYFKKSVLGHDAKKERAWLAEAVEKKWIEYI